MKTNNILEAFFDKKVLSILKLFLFDDTSQFYLREISKKSRVPIATTYRIVQRLIDLGIVEETLIKKTRLYSLSANKNTTYLTSLLEEKKTAIDEFVETAKALAGVELIIMHGEESRDKTNIIIVGSGIDQKAIKDKVGEIKEKYNFNIIELVVERPQFEQMSGMGFVSGKKVVLWPLPT